MTFPQSFPQKIGFDRIVSLLQQACITKSAAGLCSRMSPIRDFAKLKTYLGQTAEFKRLLMLEAPFPEQDYYDLGEELAPLRIEGTYITLEGLQRLRASYATLRDIKAYFNRLDAEAYPQLAAFSARLEIDPGILPKIDTILSPTGEVRDNASENLSRIRGLIRRKSAETQRHIGKYMNLARQQGWVEDDADVTVRNERLVIPVASAYKKSMRGFIHDVSSSGQTVFMEPEEIFNLNNESVELRNDERLEIIQILKDFSSFLRPGVEALLKAYRFLSAVDFLRAKARLAIRLQAGLPVVENAPCLEWRQARHPLLLLNLEKEEARARARADGRPGEVVPLDLVLEPGERIVVISGPNAGGKSVCLKTVGLLQYMLQCGLLVSMREDSRMGIFHDIFVDIGDEQSIENDLSTYSSHLKNMRFWMENAGRGTLFLSDELGSGTEPQVGGAIAEAIVEYLLQKGAWGIVTTHYTNLKLLANHHPGIVNGAMLFDQENLRPLYLFRKGLPGSSFAFEIARKIGLPEKVLAQAKRKVGRRQMAFEQELQQIEVEKQEIGKKRQELQVADELLHATLEKYNGLLAQLQENRAKLMHEAKDQARQLVKQSNALIERTIREIREAQAEKETTLRLRKGLQQAMEEGFPFEGQADSLSAYFPDSPDRRGSDHRGPDGRSPDCVPGEAGVPASAATGETGQALASASRPGEVRPEAARPAESFRQAAVARKPDPARKNGKTAGMAGGPLQAGMLVRVKGGGKTVARIGEIQGKQARVDFDYISMHLPLDRLLPLDAQETRQYEANRNALPVKIANYADEKLRFRPQVDLRGSRGEEAVESVSKLIDQAVLFGEKHLEILHGKGNGVLRQLIRGMLAKNPHVQSFADQKEDLGGAGITVVELH